MLRNPDAPHQSSSLVFVWDSNYNGADDDEAVYEMGLPRLGLSAR